MDVYEFDKDRFPCYANPTWQNGRAETKFYDWMLDAERKGYRQDGETVRIREMKEQIRRCYAEFFRFWEGDVGTILEFINVMTHRRMTWEQKERGEGEISSYYAFLVSGAHRAYRKSEKEKRQKNDASNHGQSDEHRPLREPGTSGLHPVRENDGDRPAGETPAARQDFFRGRYMPRLRQGVLFG